MKQIKIFAYRDYSVLEAEVNKFLKTLGRNDFIGVQYQNSTDWVSVLIEYKENF